MKLSAKASYAIRAVVELTKVSSKDWVKSKDLAQKIDAPPDFLAQIVLDLKKAGLIKAQRGIGGGVKLAKDPRKINLKQIIEAVEGKVAIKKCFENESACPHYPNCPFVQTLKDGQNQMLAVYEKRTLADLVKEKNV